MATKKAAGTKSTAKPAEKVVTPAKSAKVSKNGASVDKEATKVTASSKATTSSKAAAKTAPVKAAPVKSETRKVVAAKAAPAKEPSAKSAPAKAAPAKAAPANAAVAKAAPTKGVPAKDVAAKDVPAKAAPAAPSKPAAAKAARDVKPASPRLTSSPFDKSFLKQQREALLSERARYLHSAQTYREEADALMNDREPGDVQFDEESGEGDTLAVERERDLALSAQAQAAVDEIDAALERIAGNTYGICRVSGMEIPRERLEAIPWATERVEFKAGGLGRR